MQKLAWHTFPADDVLHALKSEKSGLSVAERTARLGTYGKNALPHHAAFRFWVILGKQFISPLSLILVAAGVATFLLHEFVDAFVIATALLINIALGVYQEGKASRVFDELAKAQTPRATIFVDGNQTDVSADTLVPGDVVLLAPGKQVPADVRVIDARSLSINEAAFTGEWIAVRKDTRAVQKELRYERAHNMAWGGTLVADGSGMGVVVATGAHTAFGKLAQAVGGVEVNATPLMQSISRLARRISFVIAAIIVGMLVLGFLRDEPLTRIFLMAVAVAVAAMPEGLPASITVVLSAAMRQVLRKGGLVKSLLAAETLGATTVILVDKTGTLTTGDMHVAGMVTARRARSGNGDDDIQVLTAALLASDGYMDKEDGKTVIRGRPVERAIIEASVRHNLDQEQLFAAQKNRIDFLAFASTRRFAASLNRHPSGKNRVYFSGAPEKLIDHAKYCVVANGVQPLTKETQKLFEDAQQSESAQGRRIIGVAYQETAHDTMPDDVLHGDPKHLVLVGLLVIEDTIRSDVKDEIARVHAAHVRVIMVTGDYPETARSIAREVGLLTTNENITTGETMDHLSDDELARALSDGTVFARVLPEQKMRIARVLQARGEVVAMTGDGVNDAPALRAADIGVAVGSGTDVAKAAADMVILENKFSSIVAGIAEGRRAVSNIRKAVLYLLSTSASEVVIIVGALAAGLPLPLLPTQLLWTNIIHEGFMSVPYAFEPLDRRAMRQKPRGLHEAILTTRLQRMLVQVSVVGGALLFGFYLFLTWMQFDLQTIQALTFGALSLLALSFALSFKDVSVPIWRIPLFNNPALLLGLGGSVAILVASFTLPPLQALLSLEPLTWSGVGLLVMFTLCALSGVELIKWRDRR